MLKNALVLARKRVLICGALAGAVIAGWIAPLLRPLFQVPAGGIGAVTLAGYPKSFDYAVVALLVAGSAIGALSAALLAGRFSFPHAQDAGVPRRWARAWPGFILVSVLMIAIHDHPYAFMEMFHEGEHLAPASVYLDGGRPYRDIFVLHGLATDGGLDRIVLGKPPSLLKSRRFQTLLDALTVALLVPIAIELAATGFGAAAGVALGFCAMGAALVPVFPYFRLLPLLSACWSLLRHLRTRSRLALFCAMASSSLGLLWSLEVGVYSSIAVAAWLVVLVIDGKKTFIRAAIVPALVAAFLPIAIILFCGADLYNFFRDSFWIIPNSIDAVWSLPAKPLPDRATLLSASALWRWIGSESARYYVPPVFLGLCTALAGAALARGDRQRAGRIAITTLFALMVFRTAAGRCSWAHTRFGVPLIGVAAVAFLFEPAILTAIRNRRGRIVRVVLLACAALPLWIYFEIPLNITYGANFIRGWPARLRHAGMVRYPLPRGRGIFTYPENAADLAALADLVGRAGSQDQPILDLSGERALYYLLDRRPAVRCPDVSMLSAPPLMREALAQLDAHPPSVVILHGTKGLDEFDGVPNRVRIPEIMAWADAHYPVHMQVGRYDVALQIAPP